jgi:phage terminase Nu1 subunit (DNA packaging protein)
MATKKKVAKKKAAKKKAARKPATTEDFKVEPHWLNKGQMAKALGISVQAFDKWEVQPVARRHKYGEAFYSVGDVVEFAEERARAQERKRWEKYVSDEVSLTDFNPVEVEAKQLLADLRLTEAKAEGQELRNQVAQRLQAPVEMVTWALAQIGAQISAALDPLPSKIKHRLPELTTAEVHLIKEEVAKCKNIAAEARIDWDEYDPEAGSEPGSD